MVMYRNKLKQKQSLEEWPNKEDASMDTSQPLQDHPKAIDAVYFNGNSKDGETLICGLARRPEGVCNAFLYLRVKGEDLLLSPKLPDTTLNQISTENGKYEVEGIQLYPIDPMKSWAIKYNGKMRFLNDPTKEVNVELNSVWTASYNHFNYDTDMSPKKMAKDLARESWNKEYFQRLQDLHQTHYEQFGKITGTVKINDNTHKIQVDCVRDHSFGKLRDWKNFHRYALHFIHLDNGDCISIGNVSMPVCFSSLTIGFICKKSENKMYPIDDCNLQLYRHGENSTPPLDYAFQFEAGGKKYTVQVDVKDSLTFFIGQEHEARIVENLSRFKVNNIDGWGATEWEYRNIDKNII